MRLRNKRLHRESERSSICAGLAFIRQRHKSKIKQLYRPQEAAPEKFERKTCAFMAGRHCRRSVSGGGGSLLTLETVRQKYPASKAGDPYEAVWKRFFPESGGRLQTGR
jgi:hypothetical protein